MRVKLTELLDRLHQDDELRKVAQATPAAAAGVPPAGAGDTTTATPDSEMVGDTVEDEKEKIQTKLHELAGTQVEAVSAAKPEETVNTAQKAPAGEAAQPTAVAVSPQASAEAEEVAEVVASALGGMQPEVRKVATVKIIEKIASMNSVSMEDLENVKVADAKAAEYDAAGRIIARAFHDEASKIAAEEAAGLEEEVEPEDKTASEDGGGLTSEEVAVLKALGVEA